MVNGSKGGQKGGIARPLCFTVIAVAVLILFVCLPVPEGLSRAGMNVIGLLLFNILMWIGDVLPKPAVGILVMILLPLLGITESISATCKDFMSTTFFILMAAFAISSMIERTSIPHRLMNLFLSLFGSSTRKIVLAFMLATAVTSAVMSDFAACALFGSIAYSLSESECLKGRLDGAFTKSLMIGIPIAALAGGSMTPIGCSANIVVLGLINKTMSISITFLQWMAIGIPLSLIAVILAWIGICIAHKPKPLDAESMSVLTAEFAETEKMSKSDIRALCVLVAMFALWIAGGWITALDAATVAMAGTVFMLLPRVGFFTWKEYQQECSWDLIIMVGSLMALAAPLLSTGVVTWFVDVAMADAANWNASVVLFVAMAVVVVLRAFIPSGSPVVVIVTPAFATMALAVGIDPVCIVIAMSIWSQITLLIPMLDAMFLITYKNGNYGNFDVFKFGLPLTVVLLVIDTFLIPVLVAAVGL